MSFTYMYKTDSGSYTKVIPTPYRYAYFAQFDWLKKKFYTSINSMSRNLGTVSLLPALKICNNVDKTYILMTRIIRNFKTIIFVDFIDV